MIEAVVGVALRAILASVVLGAVLSGLVLVVTRRSALTAATRHALWTTAMIATAVMPLAGIAVSLIRATPAETGVATQWSAQGGLPAQHSRQPSRYVQTWTRTPAGSLAIGARTATSGTTQATAPPSGVMFALAGWTPRVTRALALGVVGGWGLGALIGMIGLAASVWRIRGLKRRSSPLDGALADELPWLTATGSGREIYLRLSYEIETPVAVGFGRPVILIPTELAGERGLATLEPLVLHEHAHLRRYDDWTNLVQRTIERLFWFNPLVWIVGRRIALEREIASDDAVVEKTGEAHAYATSLWRLAREMRMPEHAVVAPGALLTRKQIAVRIERLLDANRGRLRRSPAAALATACAGIAAVAFVATSAPAVELPARESATETMHAASHVQQRTAQAPQHIVHAAVRVASAPTKTKIVYVPVPSKHAGANAAGSSSLAIVSPPAPPVPADRHVPATALAVPPAPHAAKAKLSLEAIAAIRAAPRNGTAAASSALSQIGVEVDVAVSKAFEHLPVQLAQLDADENTHAHPLPSTGAKLSRELISTCLGCSFRNADLRGFDFHGLTLKSDDFGGADLRGANFAGAKLTGVSLRGANLANADLRGATLTGVDLRGASLTGARIEDLNLTGVSLRNVGITGVSLRGLLLHCVGCDLSHLDLHGVDLHGVSLTGVDLNHTDLHSANLSGAHLTGVDLSGTNLTGADMTNTQLEGCDLRGVVLRDATTTGMTLIGSSLGD